MACACPVYVSAVSFVTICPVAAHETDSVPRAKPVSNVRHAPSESRAFCNAGMGDAPPSVYTEFLKRRVKCWDRQ